MLDRTEGKEILITFCGPVVRFRGCLIADVDAVCAKPFVSTVGGDENKQIRGRQRLLRVRTCKCESPGQQVA